MSTITPFLPSTTTPFSFAATLDGAPYTIKTSWNVSAQRYYINVYSSTGAWVLTTALTQSPPARQIASVNFNPFQNVLEVDMISPLTSSFPLSPGGIYVKPGTIVDYTLEQFTPTTYNGLFRGMHVNETLFTVPMTTDPGALTIMGYVSRKLNMVAPLFTSTLIYRNGAFEVDP
jgi:hypothetical protein